MGNWNLIFPGLESKAISRRSCTFYSFAALLGLSHKSRKLIRKEGGVSSGGVLTCVGSVWSALLQ